MARRSKAPRREAASRSWWELWPDLYDQELAAFTEKGVTYKVLLKQWDLLILQVDWPIEGRETLLLNVGFSPLHPFVRPAIAAPDADFERHQNPFSKELCFLTQESRQWNAMQLVADFIDERLKQLLSALNARASGQWEVAADLEERASDPLTPYFDGTYEENSVVLFNGQMLVPDMGFGLLDITVRPRPPDSTNAQPFEAILNRVKTCEGRILDGTFDLPNGSATAPISGRWVRLRQPAITNDPMVLLREAQREIDRQTLLQPHATRLLNMVAESAFSITGIVFAEEVEYQRTLPGAGWLFVVTRREPSKGTSNAGRPTLVRAERCSKGDILARLPIASALQAKKVLLLGCGAIGGFVAVDLARAGVGRLELLDFDVVRPGNSLRWPIGREAWGVKKTTALAKFITHNYPLTKAIALDCRIGGALANPERLPKESRTSDSPIAQVRNLIRDVDLVIDVTASSEVQAAIAYLCRDVGKAHIIGYATSGLVGGFVARFSEASDACWVCINERWRDGSLPQPREDLAGMVTPIGCNSPTFSGGAYDLQEVSLEIVRTAVGTLSDGLYDPGSWAAAILDMRDDDGHRVPPRWTTYNPMRHPQCTCAKK